VRPVLIRPCRRNGISSQTATLPGSWVFLFSISDHASFEIKEMFNFYVCNLNHRIFNYINGDYLALRHV